MLLHPLDHLEVIWDQNPKYLSQRNRQPAQTYLVSDHAIWWLDIAVRPPTHVVVQDTLLRLSIAPKPRPIRVVKLAIFKLQIFPVLYRRSKCFRLSSSFRIHPNGVTMLASSSSWWRLHIARDWKSKPDFSYVLYRTKCFRLPSSVRIYPIGTKLIFYHSSLRAT